MELPARDPASRLILNGALAWLALIVFCVLVSLAWFALTGR